MRRRWLLNLALLLLLAGLGALAWHVEQTPSGERVLGLSPENINSILIQRPGTESLRLQREQGVWWITVPERVAASEFHVLQVLKVAESISLASYPLDTMEPARLGLDPPRSRLEMDGQVLLFGATDAVDGLRYVQSGERIHLVRDRIAPLLEGPWWNFIDRRLLPPAQELVRVETPFYDLVRTDDHWTMNADADAEITAEPEQLAIDWSTASALVVRQVRRQADVPPLITLHFADGSRRGFSPAVESGEQRLVDMPRGLAYVFDPQSRDYLLKGQMPDSTDAALPATTESSQ